jgi:hypothetical protein
MSYKSCESTYATLCIYTGDLLIHNSINNIIGDNLTSVSNRNNKYGSFVSTKDCIHTNDLRDHLYYLLNRLDINSIAKIMEMNCIAYISVMWVSATGNGGPILSPDLMMRLGELKLELDFDIWFSKSHT